MVGDLTNYIVLIVEIEKIMKKQKLNPYKLERVRTRYHKKLFDAGSPFGHRIHKDKSKQTPRKHKYKGIDINVEED